jgi:acyl-CoA thioesterase
MFDPASTFQKDRFAHLLGIELVEVSAGHAVARLRLAGDHLNGVQIAHGGALFTLADLAFALASNSHGYLAVALSASIQFLRPATAGSVLTARASELSRGSRVSSYLIRITDESEQVVAVFQGLAYRKSDRTSSQPQPHDQEAR